MFCKNCGAEIADNVEACPNCNTVLTEKKAAEKNDKMESLGGNSKLVVALICFFFGAFGVHNFMMGETNRGVVRLVATLVLCGFVGEILALIDLIKILTDSYTVDKNALI